MPRHVLRLRRAPISKTAKTPKSCRRRPPALKHPKHPKRTPQRDPACVHLNSCVNPSRAQTCVVCNEWSRGRVSAEQKIPKMLKMAKTGCGGQAAVRPKSLKRSIGPEGAAWPKCPKRAAAQRPLAPKRQLGWREAPAAKSS